MLCNNPKLHLAKINADIKFGEILPIGSQGIERKRNFGINSGINFTVPTLSLKGISLTFH